MYGGPPPPPPGGGGGGGGPPYYGQHPPNAPYGVAPSAPYDPYQTAQQQYPQQHYGYGAPAPPPPGYGYAAPSPPPPPPPPAGPYWGQQPPLPPPPPPPASVEGVDAEYDPFAVAPTAPPPPPPPPPPADLPPPPPPPPPPSDAAAERRREDDETMRDMEARLQADKEAHAKRVTAERLRQHQQAAVAPRKAVPTVAMRGRPAAALKRKGSGTSAAAVFSRGDSSDEEDGGGMTGGKDEAVAAGAAASSSSSGGAEAAGGEEALSEEAKATIRKTAEWLAGDAGKEAALLAKARADSKLSFLLPPASASAKPSAGHAFYLEVKEELRVKEQVRKISMGLDGGPKAPSSYSSSSSSSSAAAASEPPQRARKRNRWGPLPGEEAAAASTAPAVAAAVVAGVGTAPVVPVAPGVKAEVMTEFLPTVMDDAAARQLREQKKMQLLEKRIREAARAQLAGVKDAKAREVALFEERRLQYEELAEKDDAQFKDTVEMAERTGGIIEGGTWEHRKRAKEMLKTADTALELTLATKGKHHVADYLPKEELEKFLTTADAAAAGQKEALPAEEDYEQHKLDADSHLGMQMLKQQGWQEGRGLGAEGKEGVAAPVNAHAPAGEAAGIGVAATHEVEEGDDVFDQYRKRMMLAYRFRPNPLNNPRRAYY